MPEFVISINTTSKTSIKNQELTMNTAILNPSIQQASTPFIAPKLFTAKRLINTKNMTQAEWLEIRRKGIGSSDCASACGLNP